MRRARQGRRARAKGHDWFASVKPGAKHASLSLLPMPTRPALLDSCAHELLRAETATPALNVRSLPNELAADVEVLLARASDRCMAA